MNRYPYYSIAKDGFDKLFNKYGYAESEKRKIQHELEIERIKAINLTYRPSRSWGEES